MSSPARAAAAAPQPLRRRKRAGAGAGRAAATKADVPVYLDAVGTVKALNTVTVRPQVDGKLLSVNFKEGQDVKKGDVLARIDPDHLPRRNTTRRSPRRRRTRRSSPTRSSISSATRSWRPPMPSPSSRPTPSRRWSRSRSAGASRPGGDRQRAGDARLHHHRRADRRAHRPPPGRRGQHRARVELTGHRRHHADAADLGALQPAAAEHRPGQRRLRQGRAAGRRVAARQQRGDRQRHACASSTTRSTRPPAP